MNENIKRIITKDEAYLKLFAILDVNNKTTYDKLKAIDKEGRINEVLFQWIDTTDYDYYNALLDKWKNSDAKVLLEEHLKENKDKHYTKEEVKEVKESLEELAETQRRLYKEELSDVASKLDDYFINHSYYIYYNLAIRDYLYFVRTLNYYFYLINRYNGTEYATELRDLIKQVMENEDTDAYGDVKKTLERLKLYKAKDLDAFDFTSYYNTIQIGLAFSELVYYGARGQDFTSDKKKRYENDYVKGLENVIDDVRLVSTDDEDIASSIKLTILNYINVAKLFYRAEIYLRNRIFELAEKHGIDIFKDIPKEEHGHITELSEDRLAELSTIQLATFVRSRAFKKETINLIVRLFSYDAETKALAEQNTEDTIKPREYRTRSLETDEERRKPYRITATTKEDIDKIDFSFKDTPKKKETDTNNHVNVSLLNSDLMKAHDTLATYNENDLERQKGEEEAILEAIKKEKKKANPSNKKLASLEIELEEKKAQIKATEERLKTLKENIEEREESLKDLTDYYLQIDTLDELTKQEKTREKAKTKKNIKALKNELTLYKKAHDNRGLFLQLVKDFETGEDVITYAEGDITLYLENKDQIIKKFTYETRKLLRYIQNQVYYTPYENNDDFILIDLDNYADETGRARSTIKHVRDQLIEAVELLRREGFKVNGKNNKYGLSYTGVISFIDDYFIIERGETNTETGIMNNTGKRTLAVHLGKTWRTILFSEKQFLQWASIPKIVDRISDKDIDKELFKTNANIVQELAHYLYETHRKDLKKTTYKRKKFLMGTLVNVLIQKGVLQTNKSNKYSRRIIEPIRDTFAFLTELKVTDADGEEKALFTFETNAFLIYDGDKKTGDIGLAGSNETLIKKTFEKSPVYVTFNVTDEAYEKIVKKNIKHQNIAKKKKEEKTKNLQLELDIDESN